MNSPAVSRPVTSRGVRVAGIAMPAVVGILAMMSMMAAVFMTMVVIEASTTASSVAATEARMLVESGLDHARMVLWQDSRRADPRCDAPGHAWMTAFNGAAMRRNAEVDMDGDTSNGPQGTGADSVWINVANSAGNMVGRYAVLVEDECGKINVNAALAHAAQSTNQGQGTHAILVGDGATRGVPLPRAAVENIVRHRLGANGLPGARGDDDHNNARLMCDGIDNNGNGVVDEDNEGVDDPGEYVPWYPRGDDRAFVSVTEAWQAALPAAPSSPVSAVFRTHATVVSRDQGMRWEETEKRWVPRVNLNAASARDVLRSLNKVARQFNVEGDEHQRRRLAATLTDYRDENSTLSTLSGEYGVESICFNEVLANEGSKIRQTYYVQNFRREDIRVHNLAYLYSDYNYRTSGDLQDPEPANRERSHTDTAWEIDQASVQRVGSGVRLRLAAAPWGNPNGYFNAVADFKTLLKARGGHHLRGTTIRWPENIWANAHLCVFARQGGQIKSTPEKAFRIARSTEQDLYLDGAGMTPEDMAAFTSTYCFAQIRSWIFEKAYYAEHPKVSDWFVFSGLQPDKYYRVYVQETNLETPSNDAIGGQRLADTLDVDGDFQKHAEQKMARLRYRYMDGKSVRADRKGCIDVMVTSAASCGPKRRNRFNAAYIARPDIVELANIGSHPISLRGWKLIANTGSLADELGIIDRAAHYSPEDGTRRIEENPVIMPRQYFYLCNNADVFDREHGGGKGLWGVTADQRMPLYEIGDDRWGVRFKIKDIREVGGSGVQGWSYVVCDNEVWKPHQFEQEVVEFQSDRASPNGMSTSPDGVRALVFDNTRNTLVFESLLLRKYSDVRPGDYAMIVGLPRVGGFVSMTLKNEYGQIASRLVEYGNPGDEATRDTDAWIGFSSEKADPAGERWVLSSNPSFGGTPERARNKASRLAVAVPGVMNRPYASVADIEKARCIVASDHAAPRKAESLRLMRAAAEHFEVTGIRLEAEEDGAHQSGWRPAFGVASGGDIASLADREAQWPVGFWSNQFVHVLSGTSRGESFAIVDNSPAALRIAGRSVPGRAALSIQPGQAYAIGPAGASPMYYARSDNDAGEWAWKDCRLMPGSYSLHVVGLNDSIRTTEFLEENHNPPLDIHVYNFVSNVFDLILSAGRYDKNDRICAGTIAPCHLSRGGGIRIKLVPHSLNDRRGSGAVRFDYAYLAHVPTEGRINVNTAPPRVLASLSGVDMLLAHNIARGIPASGSACIKPYRSLGDLLGVRGMTLDSFGRLANQVTIRSDQFSVRILSQSIVDANHDGRFDLDKGDRIAAISRARCVVDRSPINRNGRIRTLTCE